MPTDAEERAYRQGSRAAWQRLLCLALRELGVDDPEAKKVAWAAEREAVVGLLRRECEELGDNDWPDDLHLADVIEKHLLAYWPEDDL